MKTLVASAMLVAFSVQARAQQPASPPRPQNIQLELLELEQDVDKALLREAMMLLGRKELKPSSERPSADDARKREAEDSNALKDYIERKKQTIVERAAEMVKTRAEAMNRLMRPTTTNRPPDADRAKLIEKVEDAQIEVQLLQTQVQAYQEALNVAINAFAAAELAADKDERGRPKAEAARKAYGKAKSKYVEVNTRFQVEQGKLMSMQRDNGMVVGGMRMGGMGGMGGGMGGGFR